jgi:signal peptidase II
VLGSTIAIALFVDLFSKWLAFQRLAGQPVIVRREEVLALPNAQINTLIPPHEATVVVPHLLELKLVLNPGAVFGFGAGGRWFFAAFTLFAIAFAVWMFARWTRPRETVPHIAIGLIIAGGLGNLYDRMVFACVRDFLHPLYSLHFPGGRPVWPYVSNIADAFLIVGIVILMAYLWRSGESHPSRKPADEPA